MPKPEYSPAIQALMAEIIRAQVLHAGGHDSQINIVRMLEIAELFRDKCMHLWCGAAVELANIGAKSK